MRVFYLELLSHDKYGKTAPMPFPRDEQSFNNIMFIQYLFPLSMLEPQSTLQTLIKLFIILSS